MTDFAPEDRLSLGSLLRRFRYRIGVTWFLTLCETGLYALIPLLIGYSIDDLLNGRWAGFQALLILFAVLLAVSIGRRVYDTRAYGTMRVALGRAQFQRRAEAPISVANARVLMGRELVDFLEQQTPEAMSAFVQVIASVVILLTFNHMLALSAGGSAIAIVAIFGMATRAFFRRNAALNAQTEHQINALETRNLKKVSLHFLKLRKQEVRLSDLESFVYGIIFLVLLSMLSFNLWFAATQLDASAGDIFAIVTYSFTFVESSVALPMLMQSLTRLTEITNRINSA
ncbi:MAG: hypothetical protein HRU30_10530 [Rhodobacteraceae bacterium]|nr:hypothetical protein [Paracoccaceae bacterium]